MAKKQSSFVRRVKGAEELQKAAEDLRKKGFEAYTGFSLPDVSVDPNGKDVAWGDFISGQLKNGSKTDNKKQRSSIPYLYFSSGNEIETGVENVGTKDLGFMEWGFGNNLPNVVALLTQMLPYTAAGCKFNVDMLAGLGPQPMYDVTQYIGGNIATRCIRYKDAGAFIQGEIGDRQRALYKLIMEHNAALQQAKEDDSQANGEQGNGNMLGSLASAGSSAGEAAEEAFSSLCESIKKEIETLQADYSKWEVTNKEVQEFIERNNLSQTWLSLGTDEVMFNISFPEILLNQQDLDKDGHPVSTDNWNPKAVGISYRSCHTTRLERMDDNGNINYVYCSNRWLDSPFVEDQGKLQNAKIIAIPALNIREPLQSMRRMVREAREKKVSVNNRPTRFVLPSIYPTAGRPYYPTPAWHSIFGGDIYEYLSTIISDRLTRKRNSNIIGRIIYMNHDYLKQLAMQADSEGNKKGIEDIRDDFYKRINTWLSNRDNAGQSLLAFTFQGSDGKEHKSFEVVEIEAASKSTAEANEKETAELSSIIFMTMGLDARLLGSSPMSLVGSSGGTDIRERFLLRQILASPTQNLMLKALDVISHFNEWDPHLNWEIKREVMTTLDNSKTGVTEASIE